MKEVVLWILFVEIEEKKKYEVLIDEPCDVCVGPIINGHC